MSSARLDSYGRHIKKAADANSREEQRRLIRQARFKASLVEDPLRPSHDIVRAIDVARHGRGSQ